MARNSIRNVLVVETGAIHDNAAEQMVSALAGLGVTVSRARIEDLPTLPVRDPLVVFGFEAVTPDLEFVDPRRTISEAMSALRTVDLQGGEVVGLGESWKIRALNLEDGATHRRCVYRATGLPRIMTPEGGEASGPGAVRSLLSQDMQRWSMAVRSSLANIAADDMDGGVIVKLDLRTVRPIKSKLDLVS